MSIGYSTCHWCHVMAHESFEDETVAQAINKDFFPVKVDREERPDVDAVYMAVCVAMNGSGGWPLTVLLTPDQKPFWAGTYLPKGQLLHLLQEAARLWREDRAEILSAGEALTAHLRQEAEHRTGAPSRELARKAVVQFAQSYDRQWGGFGPAPKFPTPHNLIFLLRYARLAGEKDARGMALHTLDYVLRELSGPQGGLCCGQDADSEGAEGKYYLLTPDEISCVLGEEDGGHFCRWYGVTQPGNFEGKSVPNLLNQPEFDREPGEMAALREQDLCCGNEKNIGTNNYTKINVAIGYGESYIELWCQ